MKGKYITPEGTTVTVDIFDEENKIVGVIVDELHYKWYGEKEYALWEKTGKEKVVVIKAEEVKEPVVVEPVKPEVKEPKPTVKKNAGNKK